MIFFVQYFAEPLGDENVKGAFINCWVKAENKSDAQAITQKIAEGKEWVVLKTTKLHLSDESFYEPGNEGLEFHRQAETDECIMVFYTWVHCSEKKVLSGKKTVLVPIK